MSDFLKALISGMVKYTLNLECFLPRYVSTCAANLVWLGHEIMEL